MSTQSYSYPDLEIMFTDMQTQSTLYRPSAFWENASAQIKAEFCARSVEHFRRLPLALDYFVPTFGSPTNSFTAEQSTGLCKWLTTAHPQSVKSQLALEQFLNGTAAALADYRVLLAADDPTRAPNLNHFSESTAGNPVEQFEFDGRRFSRSSLNYLLGLALLKKHLGNESLRVVMEIGGGFGTLGEILASSAVPGLRYIDIDIPPTAFAAQYYLTTLLGADRVATYAQTRDRETLDLTKLPQASVLCPWQIERLRGKVDLFVNFISFQEMEPQIVRNYLTHVSRLGTRWILLRNLREGKQRRSSPTTEGVNTPILAEDYIAMLPDYTLVERNVNPFGYRTVDHFHSELLLLKRKL